MTTRTLGTRGGADASAHNCRRSSPRAEALERRVLLAGVSPAGAVVATPGPEFRINTHTLHQQQHPATAMNADGDFVVVWQSSQQDDPSSAAFGIYGQRYNAAGGPAGPEFLVNTTVGGAQTFPAVAMSAAGAFVVCWQAFDGVDALDGIFAQRFSAAGVKQGPEFLVNTETDNQQARPAVAMDADGDFVVAWQSAGQDNPPLSAYGVYAQRFNAAGARQGDEFRANVNTVNNQFHPGVAMDHAGNFVIAWSSINQDPGGTTGTYAQRYTAAGVGQGEFRVNTYLDYTQWYPSVAMDADGDFAIAWASDGFSPNNGVQVQLFDAAGARRGGAFRANTEAASYQNQPSIAMDADGDFVVAWQKEPTFPPSGPVGIWGQQFNSGGAKVGPEFQANIYTGANPLLPAVAMDADGDFVVAWNSYGQESAATVRNVGVYARHYTVPGAPGVAAVYVRGTPWSLPANAPFGQYLEANGLGDDVLGLRVDNLNANATIPWININQVVLRYDAPVSAGGISHPGLIILDGVRSNYELRGVAQFDAQTLVLTFDRPLGNQPGGGNDGDRVRMNVSEGAAGGGAYALTLNTLQGDADRNNGRVNAVDLAFVKARANRTADETPPAGGAAYTPFADVDANGRINAVDLAAVKARANDSLPPAAAFSSGPMVVLTVAAPLGRSTAASDVLGPPPALL